MLNGSKRGHYWKLKRRWKADRLKERICDMRAAVRKWCKENDEIKRNGRLTCQ
jgi:hypothetical protein